MPNDLEVAKQFEIVITNEQKELVRRTIAPDATDSELALFFYDCTRRGVHPLDKLIHFTKRNGKYTPITSIDMFRQRASESGEHFGTDDAIYLGDVGKPEFAASVTVYKKVQGEKCAFTATARWSEYFPGEKQGFMWQKMPHLMLAKCAEALALRKAFPAQLHGLYTPEEMAQAESHVRSTIPQVRLRNDATMVQAGTDPYTGEPTRQAADGPQSQEATPPAAEAQPRRDDPPAHSHAKAFCDEQASKAASDEHEAEGYIGNHTPRLAGKQSPPGRFTLDTLHGELTLQYWDRPEGLGTPNHSYAKVTYRQSERAGKGGKTFTNNELLSLQWAAPPA